MRRCLYVNVVVVVVVVVVVYGAYVIVIVSTVIAVYVIFIVLRDLRCGSSVLFSVLHRTPIFVDMTRRLHWNLTFLLFRR